MELKPRTSVGLKRAMVYKRYQQLDKSNSLMIVYKTTYSNTDKYWLFDYTMAGQSKNNVALAFIEIEEADVNNFGQSPIVVGNTAFCYLDKIQGKNYGYQFTNGRWVMVDYDDLQLPTTVKTANIAKYQTNKYYYTRSFDFMLRGDVSGSTVQYVKGNTMPLVSLSIRYFDDYVDLQPDDLVVMDGRLFSVENPQQTVKYSPKRYVTYFATLNSIL